MRLFYNNLFARVKIIAESLVGDISIRQLAGKGLLALLIKVATAGLSFAMFACAANLLGPVEYGRYAILFSLGTFMSFICVGGLHTLVLRKLPTSQFIDVPEKAIAVIRDGYLGILIISAIVVIIFVSAAIFGAATGQALYTALIASALAVPLALAEYQIHVLRGWNSVNLALLPRDVLWRLGVLAVMSLVVGQGINFSALEAFGWTAGVLLALIAVQFALGLRRVRPSSVHGARAIRSSPLGCLVEARWLWATCVVGAILPQLSVVVVGAMTTTSEAGIFFAAQRTANLLSLPLVAANLIGAPMMARAWAEDNRRQLQQICSVMVVVVALPTLVGVGLCAAMGARLLAFFDPSFAEHSTVLVIFATAALFNALYGPSGFLMLMTGHERSFVKILASFQMLGLVLAAAGAAGFGIIGAATGVAVGIISWNFAVRAWVCKNLKVDPTIFGLRLRSPF